MIDSKSLSLDWLQKVSAQNKKADTALVEKVVRALLLLEGLIENDVNFVFKGGTALMLKLGSTKRLSIDIDIIISGSREDLEEKMSKMIPAKGFSKLELHKRKTNSAIEKAHYKFYYTPSYHGGRKEDNILLDILFEDVQYRKLEKINITSSFVMQNDAPLEVVVPSFEDLLGDKLTAFAPETTGIPYEKSGQSKAMEIIKQLYDIGNIFEHVTDLETVAATFYDFAKTEMAYRDLGDNPQIVIDDIFNTSLTICTRGKDGNANFGALQNGISQIKAFIFSESYQIEKAITHAAKAAYIVKLVQFKKKTIERFDNPMEIKDWVIKQPFYTKLNKLKKSNPEAFFYWFKIYELEK